MFCNGAESGVYDMLARVRHRKTQWEEKKMSEEMKAAGSAGQIRTKLITTSNICNKNERKCCMKTLLWSMYGGPEGSVCYIYKETHAKTETTEFLWLLSSNSWWSGFLSLKHFSVFACVWQQKNRPLNPSCLSLPSRFFFFLPNFILKTFNQQSLNYSSLTLYTV